MRILFLLGFLVIAFMLVRARWQRWKRQLRGQPEPERQGPSSALLLAIAMLVVYGLLLGYRIFVGGDSSTFLY